jgi:hypothetical protein
VGAHDLDVAAVRKIAKHEASLKARGFLCTSVVV